MEKIEGWDEMERGEEMEEWKEVKGEGRRCRRFWRWKDGRRRRDGG